jgi:hypothetical protein
MEINAILGAVGGAIVGAIAWAAIAIFTGYEIGWIAWGVGGAVGYGAYALEGRGMVSGIVCAVLAALAILGGKVMVVNHFVNEELTQFASDGSSEELYNALKADAAAFASVASETEYPTFMVERGYSEAPTATEVPPEEIADFKEYSVPTLQQWGTAAPTYEEWQTNVAADAQSYAADALPMTELLFGSLGAMDLLFFGLGIFTAFKVGYGAESE